MLWFKDVEGYVKARCDELAALPEDADSEIVCDLEGAIRGFVDAALLAEIVNLGDAMRYRNNRAVASNAAGHGYTWRERRLGQ